MNTSSFTIQSKTEDFHEDIADDVKNSLTLNCRRDNKRRLPNGMNKKVIDLFKEKNRKKDYDRIFCSQTKNIFLLKG